MKLSKGNIIQGLLLLVIIIILFTISITFYINAVIDSLEDENNLLQTKLAQKNNIIQSLNTKINNRNWSNYWTKELLIKLADNIQQIYYIRNEIMYYNKDMKKEEVSYQAIWIYAWSIENNVPPYLTTAVLVQESKLRHLNDDGTVITSPKGAKGIGQLMPVIERLYSVNAAIFEENVKGTTLFLKDLNRMYAGNLNGVLGHYNGGSRPYEKIRDYTETREFVADVRHIYETMNEKYNQL